MLKPPSHLYLNRQFSDGRPSDRVVLRTSAELPEKFRQIFDDRPYFNILQSKVLDDIMNENNGLVVSAPTGSGKTGVLELLMAKLFMDQPAGNDSLHTSKAVYLAPIKALCDERFTDWSQRFGLAGFKCCKMTGDSDGDEYSEMKEADIVISTPEKFDSLTRRWRDNDFMVKMVRLFMIDEVHLVGDTTRGATLETVVSRMKAVSQKYQGEGGVQAIRFAAVSATLQNIEDFGEWLGSPSRPARVVKVGEDARPVKIQKIVLGYPSNSNNEFRFDMSLDYKLLNVIQTYSGGKPTLIFCSTRKSTSQAAINLLKGTNSLLPSGPGFQHVRQVANTIVNIQLRECLLKGAGFHHAGLDRHDRTAVESLFLEGALPVLCSTSTLAMGVNLPAHLVIIKSTSYYASDGLKEYSQTEVMQMIGRAGRPQFDTSAVAVIMTKTSLKPKFDHVVNATQVIESVLHQNLIEHVNAEISLRTFFDADTMLAWIQSTFLYIRIMKNPAFYFKLEKKVSIEDTHLWLQDIASSCLRALKENGLITGNGAFFQGTAKGNLMAKYYIAFDTMVLFGGLSGSESLAELIEVLSRAKEFADVTLRVSEKMTLNTLNRNKNVIPTIRFPMKGKIQSTAMKVNCLIQAALGSLSITESGLLMDINKIFRSAKRVMSCLLAYVRSSNVGFKLSISTIQLAKCLEARMWENSDHVARQITGIGTTLSASLVTAGYTTFSSMEQANPRELELIVNRRPPFGNRVIDAVARLPKYTLTTDQTPNLAEDKAEIVISLRLQNSAVLKDNPTAGHQHTIRVLVGDLENKAIVDDRVTDSQICRMNGTWSRKVTVQRVVAGGDLHIALVSETLIGLDISCSFAPFYTEVKRTPVVTKNFPVHVSNDTQAKKQKAKPKKFQQTKLDLVPRKRKRRNNSQEFSTHTVNENSSGSSYQTVGEQGGPPPLGTPPLMSTINCQPPSSNIIRPSKKDFDYKAADGGQKEDLDDWFDATSDAYFPVNLF